MGRGFARPGRDEMILPGLEQVSGNHRRLSRWWARAELLAMERGQTLLGLGTLLAACAYLLRELAPDVGRKPLHPDEAVTGLVAARPLPEMLSTVLVERGGPPFHFLAAHVALLFDPSAQALRWTSVAFALGTVLLCYDLGRRIAGHTAGATAALVAATSTMLGQLGTFGRMYAAFAFTAALAADMFYRALEQRTTRAAVVAALAAVLAAATHTYGIFILLAEAVVALVLWRGTPPRRRARRPRRVADGAGPARLHAPLRTLLRGRRGGLVARLAARGRATAGKCMKAHIGIGGPTSDGHTRRAPVPRGRGR